MACSPKALPTWILDRIEATSGEFFFYVGFDCLHRPVHEAGPLAQNRTAACESGGLSHLHFALHCTGGVSPVQTKICWFQGFQALAALRISRLC